MSLEGVAREPIADVHARRGEEGAHGSAARRMFDRIAPTYDTVNHVMSAGIDRRWRARTVAQLT
jgi:ubiquinone/menaquinone biosynthesis C-methylase UbiE